MTGADGGLTAALARLAGDRCDVVEVVAAQDEDVEDELELEDDTAETPVVASDTPSPLREPVTAVRAETTAERETAEPEPTVAMEHTATVCGWPRPC